jgi:hypothetical protein
MIGEVLKFFLSLNSTFLGFINDMNLQNCFITMQIRKVRRPVRIRVRIDSPLSFVCCKRRLNGVGLQMRPEKPRSFVTAGVA